MPAIAGKTAHSAGAITGLRQYGAPSPQSAFPHGMRSFGVAGVH